MDKSDAATGERKREKVHSVKHDELKKIKEDIEQIKSVRKRVFVSEKKGSEVSSDPESPVVPMTEKKPLRRKETSGRQALKIHKRETESTAREAQPEEKKAPESGKEGAAQKKNVLFSLFSKKTQEDAKKGFASEKVARHGKRKRFVKHRHMLQYHLEKCGYEIDDELVMKRIVMAAAILNGVVTIAAFFADFRYSFINNISFFYGVYLFLTLWVFVFAALILLVFLTVFVYLDLRIYQRRIAIEEVLPEFLHLTSANVRAGMPIDQALWYAVRPNFGVLAKEIEQVAKSVMSGNELRMGLEAFAKKYDSDMLQRSVSLLIEGMEAGGEVGDLLNKIANDINDAKILQQEMAANVTSYTIFITFASVAAAPFLFALSYVLLTIISGLVSGISSSIDPTAASSLPFSIGGQSIAPSDFTIFAIAMLTVTSFFSAMITSSIKHGDPRKGLRSIPIFIIVSIVLYFVGLKMFSGLMHGIL